MPPCRVPLAPPQSLVLSENEFRPFKQQAGSVLPPAVACSGEQLQLRAGGAAARREFERGELAGGLAKLLDPSEVSWREWSVALDYVAVDPVATAAWLERYNAWAVDVAQRRAQRAADKTAAAAADAEATAVAAGDAPAEEPAAGSVA